MNIKEQMDVTVFTQGHYFVYRYYLGKEPEIIEWISAKVADPDDDMTEYIADRIVGALADVSRRCNEA